jgi:hypothetical protein
MNEQGKKAHILSASHALCAMAAAVTTSAVAATLHTRKPLVRSKVWGREICPITFCPESKRELQSASSLRRKSKVVKKRLVLAPGWNRGTEMKRRMGSW